MGNAGRSARGQIVAVGVGFELGIGLAAAVVGIAIGHSAIDGFHWSWRDAGAGVVATIPMLVLFWMVAQSTWPPFERVRGILDEFLLPILAPCTTLDLLAISIAAGIGEEVAFRGLLQSGLAEWLSPTAGLVLASVLFGLAHCATATYAIVTALIGIYLGSLWMLTNNLLAPMTAHALYDFVGLVYLLKGRAAPTTSSTPAEEVAPTEFNREDDV